MADREDKPAHDGAGHRARLRERLAINGGQALHDHELIEYLLALAIPRRDTKALAKTLLREFGGIGGVFTADREALLRVKGMGEVSISALKIAQANPGREVVFFAVGFETTTPPTVTGRSFASGFREPVRPTLISMSSTTVSAF